MRWIDDTCNRASYRDWLNYHHEIALHHHGAKKDQTEDVDSTDVGPMRYLVTLVQPMSDVRSVLERGDSTAREIDRVTDASGKSLATRVWLWTHPYDKDGDWWDRVSSVVINGRQEERGGVFV